MFEGPKPQNIENWVCVMERNTEFEVDMAKSFLSDLQIPSMVLNKRDRAYSFTIGEMALVYLYVPKEFEQEAREALKEWENSDLSDSGEE